MAGLMELFGATYYFHDDGKPLAPSGGLASKILDASLGASVVAGLRRARERLCALLGQSLVHFMAYEGRRLGLLSDEESAPAPG